MLTTYIVITVLAAAANAYAARNDFLAYDWIVDNMRRLGIPRAWLMPLGLLKAAGAVGLLVGIWIPVLGVAASVGLILFFVGALVVVAHARWYAHWYPAPFLLLAIAA